MILALINAAQDELVLTTPYLVPDDSLLRAMRGAAGRGVTVRLIVPEKVDSLLTRYASRSYYDDLLEVGVEIYLYRGGLVAHQIDHGRRSDVDVRHGESGHAKSLAQL